MTSQLLTDWHLGPCGLTGDAPTGLGYEQTGQCFNGHAVFWFSEQGQAMFEYRTQCVGWALMIAW